MALPKTTDKLATENQIYRDPESFADLTPAEREVLKIVQTELQGWDQDDLEKVLSVMADDAIYWDVTLDPAVGKEGIREFGEGWLEFCPNFGCFVEKLVVKGDTVVSVGQVYRRPTAGRRVLSRAYLQGGPALRSLVCAGGHSQGRQDRLRARSLGFEVHGPGLRRLEVSMRLRFSLPLVTKR